MKISKKFSFAYFIFLFINGLKNLLHFLHFKFMITLSVTLIFFWMFSKSTFSNLKLNVFIITGFICSNNYLEQLVLTN